MHREDGGGGVRENEACGDQVHAEEVPGNQGGEARAEGSVAASEGAPEDSGFPPAD